MPNVRLTPRTKEWLKHKIESTSGSEREKYVHLLAEKLWADTYERKERNSYYKSTNFGL